MSEDGSGRRSDAVGGGSGSSRESSEGNSPAAAPRAQSSRGRKPAARGVRTAAASTRARLREHFGRQWQQALRGDAAALDALLLRAVEFDAASEEGRAGRRMVSRLYAQRSRQLNLQVQALPPGAASEAQALRAQAQKLFYRALLAEHYALPVADAAAATVTTAAGNAASPAPLAMPPPASIPFECQLDPPPDLPPDCIATTTGLGNLEALVQWGEPNTNGKAILRYEVDSLPKGLKPQTVTAREARFTGLLPTQAYGFQVRATNADGTGPLSLASNAVTPGKLPPGAPTSVAMKLEGSVPVVSWKAPTIAAAIVPGTPTAAAPTQYWVSAYDQSTGTTAKPPQRRKLAGTAESCAFTGLAAGNYKFAVRAFNNGGHGPEASTAAAVDYKPAPTPVLPELGALPALDPTLLFGLGQSNLDVDGLKKHFAGALAQANKWRYEHLKTQALKAATDTLQYEALIAQVMQMALSKVHTAEMLLSPVLQSAIEELTRNVSTIQGLGLDDKVEEIVNKVGEAASNALALESLIKWFTTVPTLDFWIGLFGGLIDDVAAFGSNGLGATRAAIVRYLEEGTLAGGLKATVADLEARVGREVDRVGEPLRAAVAQIVSGTNQALEDLFKSFDNPLLMAAGPGGVVTPVTNPLQKVLNQLREAVEQLIAKIKGVVTNLIRGLGVPGALADVIIVFIALPILSIMVVSFALGPIGAGIIGAVVMIAAVSLVHLILSWLSGPLLGVLRDLQKKVFDTVQQLGKILARTAQLLGDPAPKLALVTGSLQELKSLLPKDFLADVAELLGQARAATMGNVHQLALAAERALGLENGTAFDAIPHDFDTRLTQAPQLPGGSNPSLLAGAGMLRDLNVLEKQRTQLGDGKELTVTHRLSLFRLLGGVGDPAAPLAAAAGSLKSFLGGGKMLVKLDEATLVDRNFPGLYRTLISDIRPVGLFAAAAPLAQALPVAIPLTITHAGPSRTRVKRRANPAAPPVELPACLKLSADDFQQAMTGGFLCRLDAGAPLDSRALHKLEEIVEAARDYALDRLSLLKPRPTKLLRATHGGGDCLLTTNADEFDGKVNRAPTDERFNAEPMEAYIHATQVPGTYPLYRLNNQHPSADDEHEHLYTTNADELFDLVRLRAGRDFIWKSEGVAGYVHLAPQGNRTVPLHRWHSAGQHAHYYTTDDSRENRDRLAREKYTYEFVACHVLIGSGADEPLPAPITTQVVEHLTSYLCDRLAPHLDTVSEGLLPMGVAGTLVRKLVERVFAAPLTEPGLGQLGNLQNPVGREQIRDEIDARKLAAVLRDGIPVANPFGPSVPGLAALAAQTYTRGLEDFGPRVAKWAGLRLLSDRDPHVGALGFATLEQDFPSETAIFNLLPDAAALGGRLSAAAAQPEALAPVAASTLQYRPFENRGLDCELLLSLESPVAPGALLDLFLEVTVRGCYDDDLAAAVKASRSIGAAQLDRVNAVLGREDNKRAVLPGIVPMPGLGKSGVKTFHLSWRAHRDGLLRIARAGLLARKGKDAKGASVFDELKFDFDEDLPLGAGDALKGFTGTDLSQVTLLFQRERKELSLQALMQTIPVTPEDFGIGLDNLTDPFSRLVGIGFAVIPTAKGVTDKVALKDLVLDPLLARLLPQAAAPGFDKATRLVLTRPNEGDGPHTSFPLSWEEVWRDPAAPPSLLLDFGDALGDKKQIHDVLFSFSFESPVPSAVTNQSTV